MKKYCPDCRYYYMKKWLPYKCPHVGAEEKICDKFEYADKRLAAGDLAMAILVLLASDAYYPSRLGATIPRSKLAEDMTVEYEMCLDRLGECEE